MATFHKIEIRVPVPEGSIAQQAKVTQTYDDELQALYAKLPAGSEKSDMISKQRDEPVKRKSADERFAEMAKARGIELGPDGKPVTPANESSRRQHQQPAAA